MKNYSLFTYDILNNLFRLSYACMPQSQYKQFLFSHPHIHNRSCNKPFFRLTTTNGIQ